MISEKVIRSIYVAVDEINGQLSESERLDKQMDTIVIGYGSKLDSMGLLSFMIILENRISEDFGEVLNVTDEEFLSSEDNMTVTIEKLGKYISTQIGDEA